MKQDCKQADVMANTPKIVSRESNLWSISPTKLRFEKALLGFVNLKLLAAAMFGLCFLLNCTGQLVAQQIVPNWQTKPTIQPALPTPPPSLVPSGSLRSVVVPEAIVDKPQAVPRKGDSTSSENELETGDVKLPESNQATSQQAAQTVKDIEAIRQQLGGGIAGQLKGLIEANPKLKASADADFKAALNRLASEKQEGESKTQKPSFDETNATFCLDQDRIDIPKGHKVVAIKVGSAGLAGLLSVGDKVDLLGVFKKRDQSNQWQTRSKTFLKNRRVFSIGSSRSNSRVSSGTLNSQAIVGVLVTEKQSDDIYFAQQKGDIKLVLRSEDSAGDDEPESLKEIETWLKESDLSQDEAMSRQSQLRNAASRLDSIAAEFEAAGLYEEADQVRTQSSDFWIKARLLDRDK